MIGAMWMMVRVSWVNPATASSAQYVPSALNHYFIQNVTGSDQLFFYMDNFDTPNPEKLVRFNITFLGDAVTDFSTYNLFDFNLWLTDPTASAGPDETFDGSVAAVWDHGEESSGLHWYTVAYDFTIRPNPNEEWFSLAILGNVSDVTGGALAGLYIDDVVIDTRCVPVTSEVPIPGAIWLLGSGLLGLIGYRKKVS